MTLARRGAVATSRREPAPGVPEPISHFDWHEGSGSTTTSLVSSHVLTAASPSTAWDGNAAASGSEFTGNIGDVAASTWTIATEFTLGAGGSWRVILKTSGAGPADELWLQLNSSTLSVWTSAGGSTGFSPAQPLVSGSVLVQLVMTNDGTTQSIYIDGVLVTSRTRTNILEPQGVIVNPAIESLSGKVSSVRFWDVALTSEEVASLAPEDPEDPEDPELFRGMTDQISRHGVTWQLDQEYMAGQFITGDWWVVGPVTVTSVSPGPQGRLTGEDDNDLTGEAGLRVDDRMRHGSMVLTDVTTDHAYDSRARFYNPDRAIVYPYSLAANRSLISSISGVHTGGADMGDLADGAGTRVLESASVLTCLDEEPPEDAFRPCYWGTDKSKIVRASDIQWEHLLNLTPSPGVPSPVEYARFFERPWLDHMQAYWVGQFMWPWMNQPGYGRGYAAVVGTAGLMVNCNFTEAQKRPIVHGLIQLAIDLAGMLKADSCYRVSGGHGSGRKFPIVFAGMMLGGDPYFSFDADAVGADVGPDGEGLPQGLFGEDASTYWGQTYYGAPACFQMVGYSAEVPSHQENPPPYVGDDATSEGYRLCCTVGAWAGQALATLLMSGRAAWNHDSYFQVVDDWMADPDPYAANRGEHDRPDDWQETHAWHPWATAMWNTYRSTVPVQANGADNFKWIAMEREWVLNPSDGSPPPAEDRNPVAYFQFGEGSGSTATSSVSSHTLAAETPGSAWGANGAVGEFLGDAGGSLGNTWSIAARFRINSSGGSWKNICSVGNWIHLQLLGDDLSVYLNGITPAGQPADIAVSTWHTLVVTCDGADSRVYFNGSLVATQADHAPIISAATFKVMDSAEPLNGEVDWVRVYRVGMDEVEATAL